LQKDKQTGQGKPTKTNFFTKANQDEQEGDFTQYLCPGNGWEISGCAQQEVEAKGG
jgi:hypothetical protein